MNATYTLTVTQPEIRPSSTDFRLLNFAHLLAEQPGYLLLPHMAEANIPQWLDAAWGYWL